jgi:hypothetical protein
MERTQSQSPHEEISSLLAESDRLLVRLEQIRERMEELTTAIARQTPPKVSPEE